jgi:hypothetical protein
MIQTPQTMADSANNMSFIPCLTLYRFPTTHIKQQDEHYIQKQPDNEPENPNMPHPNRIQPNFSHNCAFNSKFNSLTDEYTISYHPGIPAGNGHDEIPYIFNDTFLANGNTYKAGSAFIYKIQRLMPAVPAAADAAAPAPVITPLTFDIQYGNIYRQYRFMGPSLSDLMMHYIHKNLQDFDNITYSAKGFPPNSSSIFSKDLYYDYDNGAGPVPFNVFKFGILKMPVYNINTNASNESIQIGEVHREIKEIRIFDKLKSIQKIVDSALGLLPTSILPELLGKGTLDEPSYTPVNANSLCRIENYNQVPAVVTSLIKILGDYDQAVAARILNQTTEFYGRIVFCSEDRSCVAHSANNGIRTIRNNEPLTIYNGTPAGAAVLPPDEPKSTKKRKQEGGFKNMLDDCDRQCLDIEQTMLTAGMNASRYLGLYKQYIKPININDQRHSDVLLDIYNDIRNKYNMYNRDLENDITDFNVKYDNNMRVFMGILNDLYYNSINTNKSLKMLIALCNIHNRNYMLPEIDYMKYVKNTNSLSQQLRKNLSLSRKKSSQLPEKSSQLPEKLLHQLHKKSSQSHKKSSQSHKKLSHSHKKSSHSHKKSGQSRKKSSLHKVIAAPVAGGF